jgi:hypothetical protein
MNQRNKPMRRERRAACPLFFILNGVLSPQWNININIKTQIRDRDLHHKSRRKLSEAFPQSVDVQSWVFKLTMSKHKAQKTYHEGGTTFSLVSETDCPLKTPRGTWNPIGHDTTSCLMVLDSSCPWSAQLGSLGHLWMIVGWCFLRLVCDKRNGEPFLRRM